MMDDVNAVEKKKDRKKVLQFISGSSLNRIAPNAMGTGNHPMSSTPSSMSTFITLLAGSDAPWSLRMVEGR